MTTPVQKAQEQRAGRAFIKAYNERHETDYALDASYSGEFPDLQFKSSSGAHPDFGAEVVRVVRSELDKANDSKVNNLQNQLRDRFEQLGYRGVFVGIRFTGIPPAKERKAYVSLVSRYVDQKLKSLRDREFEFDWHEDLPVFWDQRIIKTTIRSIKVSLVETDSVSVLLLGEAKEVFPEEYIKAAIVKKMEKYSPTALDEVFLLLDCDFILIDEHDMQAFAANFSGVKGGFSQLWCVNILADRTIVEKLA